MITNRMHKNLKVFCVLYGRIIYPLFYGLRNLLKNVFFCVHIIYLEDVVALIVVTCINFSYLILQIRVNIRIQKLVDIKL